MNEENRNTYRNLIWTSDNFLWKRSWTLRFHKNNEFLDQPNDVSFWRKPLLHDASPYSNENRFLFNYKTNCVEKKNQLDATEWFIALIICSTCFGHFYAHHQELESILVCVLLPPMVCDALVAGCWRSGTGQPAVRSGWETLLPQQPSFRTHSRLSCTWPPTTSNQGIALHRWYSLELLMMGIEVPETCWAYYKCNKPFTGI